MSAPANGRYTIVNVKYANSVVDLNGGNAYSPITAFKPLGNLNQQWYVRRVGDTERFVIQNAYSGTFASINFQVDGAPLAGSPNATVWAAERVGTSDVYQIRVWKQNLEWALGFSGEDYGPIVMKPDSDANATNAQWRFKPV